MAKQRIAWTEDEIKVLAAIFFHAQFSIGDDARAECRLIADCFGRTPSSIDRQWRNLAAVVSGKPNVNIGAAVKRAVTNYLSNPQAAISVALKVAERRQWPLASLIRDGEAEETALRPVEGRLAESMKLAITKLCDDVDYKIFASGSHGYEARGNIGADGGRSWEAAISCTMVGSREVQQSGEVVNMKTSKKEIRTLLSEIVQRCHPQQMPSGRVALHHNERTSVGDERFSVSVRVIEKHR